MAKYVIEIEDVPFGRNDDPVIPHGMDELYRAKGFKSLVFDQNGLGKLTPYTEPDLNPLVDEAVETIENEVWELARKIADMKYEEFSKCFDVSDDYREVNIMDVMSYSEAKAKYEKWMKQKNEIHVGDEVKPINLLEGSIYNEPWVVTMIDVRGGLWGIGEKVHGHHLGKDDVVKTGRSFPEVTELIKKMRCE